MNVQLIISTTYGLSMQVNPSYVKHSTLRQVNLVIMWDGQHDAPAQNALGPLPYVTLSRRQYVTSPQIIKHRFLPALEVLLMAMVKSANLSAADLHAFGTAVCDIHAFFQGCDWTLTWALPQVLTFPSFWHKLLSI